MTPHYADDWLTVYGGDARVVLPTLPADSVDCIVTSPPYWGLRDYGSDGQLGLEPTPEQYVGNLVGVFRELRRVLKPSGTCWLNLGDSYAGSGRGGNPPDSKWSGYVGSADRERAAMPHLQSKQVDAGAIGRNWVAPPPGLKQKDLVGIPWRVAFALQADGWWLRSDIIWAKPNPMPESVTDRPTKAHEYLFLLTKAERYYYDAAAVAEPLTDSSINLLSQPHIDQQEGSWRVPGKTNGAMKAVGGPSWRERKAAGAHPGSHGVGSLVGNGTQREVHGAGLSHDLHTKPVRNLRSVWTIATRPYPGAHFAVFPPELPERCIKAGCPELVCADCGNPVQYDSGNEGLSRVLDTVYPNGAASEDGLLFQALRQSGDSPDPLDHEGVRQDGSGLHRALPTDPSDGDEDGVHPRTPASDGRGSGAVAPANRSRGPHQRDQGRQPPGESAGSDEEGARRSVESGAPADGAVSELRSPLPAPRSCGQCGSNRTTPGVVLDCFAGSGTVGIGANRLSRRAILIDLNADYLRQQMARNAQTPLGLGVA